MDHRKMSTVNCRSAMKNGTDLLLLDDRGLGTCENRHYGYIRSDNLIIRHRFPAGSRIHVYGTFTLSSLFMRIKLLVAWILLLAIGFHLVLGF